MSNNRDAIPEPLRRKIRQKYGFCCVMCNCPIFEIDHLDEWSKVKEHKEENLVPLCPNCHTKKNRVFSKSDIQKKAEEVVQEKSGRTGSISLHPKEYNLVIGGNRIFRLFTELPSPPTMCIFNIEGLGDLVINATSGQPLIYANIFDSTGLKTLEIDGNEITFSKGAWDIEYKNKTITLREGLRRIYAEITIDPERSLITFNGKVQLENDIKISLKDTGIFLNSKLLAYNNFLSGSFAALIITKEDTILPACFTGQTNNSMLRHNMAPIAMLNVINSSGNCATGCLISCIWTLPFLKSIS